MRTMLITTLIISCNNMLGMNKEPKIYLENHYGATIKYKKGKSDSTAEEIAVPNQGRVLIGMYDPKNVINLSIRTTGTGSRFMSYFTELSKQIEEIQSNRFLNKDKNAVIIVKPSKSYQSWDIEVRWEKSNTSITQLPGDLAAEHELQKIMDGSLGRDYANKATAINNYDYTKSTKRGQINLKTALLKSIKETVTQTYEKYHGRKEGDFLAPDLSTTEDLKKDIDRLHRSLLRYKTQDNQ